MNRNFLITTILILFAVNIFPQGETLEALIEKAIAVSPKLKMLKMKQRAALNKVEQESNLPDPMLMLGVMNLPAGTYSFTEDAMTAKTIGVTQDFPFPGKLSKIAEVEKADVDIMKYEILDDENEIRTNFTMKYNELRLVRKSIQLLNENLELIKSISEIVKTKYSVSSASQQEIFKIELEISSMTAELYELTGEEKSLLAELNALLLRENETEIAADEFPEIIFTERNPVSLFNDAVESRPILKNIKLAKEKESIKESLSEYDYYPEFSFGFQFGYRENIVGEHGEFTDHLVSYNLGVSIPLNYGGKISAKIEENQTMQIYYDEQFQFYLQTIKGKIGASTSKLKSLEERIKLISEQSLLQAEENLRTSLIAYQVGRSDFLYLIDAQQILLKLQNNLFKLKTEYLNELAELEFITGKRLTD